MRSRYAAFCRASSPLTRGKRGARHDLVDCVRLIPAHAGKTECFPHGMSAPRAHPHSRGENHPRFQPESHAGGSSPLTRGKRGARHDLVDCVRLIPAHAGTTTTSSSAFSPTRAHPHSRGENLTCASADCAACGSSPLTRGKQAHGLDEVVVGGLIPTHAGKTRSWRGP